MDNLIKMFVGTLLVLILALAGITVVSSSVYSKQADQALAYYETMIENANMTQTVINNAKQDASAHGYTLATSNNKTDYNNVTKPTKLSLTYYYTIPFAGRTSKTITTTLG